jgi:hypothetical protein
MKIDIKKIKDLVMQDSTHINSQTIRVGIITFHRPHNYGAILQAYALYQYLHQTLRVEVCVIDFMTELYKRELRILPEIQWSVQFPKIVGLYLLKLAHYRSFLRKKSRFEHFTKEFFVLTRPYNDFDDLRSSLPELDAVITGSDQVFNYRMLKDTELSAYCLKPFSSEITRKIGFAPSFGNDSVPPDIHSKMAAWLADFHSLSARESNGAIMIEEMTGRRTEVLFDPVFLHEAQHWRKLALSVELPYSEFILCYALVGRSSLGDLAAKIKLLTGLPILLVTSNVRSGIKADSTFYDIGPREFLWLLDHAQYVVTDSFHGTAFASLFEKDFYSHIVLPQRAQRIIGLLKAIGLESRLAKQAEDIISENLSIDFTFSRQVIMEQRNKSASFLQEALFNIIN